MDVLSSKTPRQIKKEIAMFAIAYNLIRGIIVDASKKCSQAIDRISFAGTLQQLNQWLWLFLDGNNEIRTMLSDFYYFVVQKAIPERPGRNEPRTKKRRPKNFNLMNKPRHEMVVDYHRNRTEKKNAFFVLK